MRLVMLSGTSRGSEVRIWQLSPTFRFWWAFYERSLGIDHRDVPVGTPHARDLLAVVVHRMAVVAAC
ncbi:hypothetical protein [Streptomyces sp. SID3343]|uniref:hypothetical protein n=1 Tax=Streptomyces sp. SID3343 TaxID=2690260 RepID=UPI0013682DD1|nr:hypothetical protein [Streptomyces sp. SID3343]MYW06076.1 hypothetical protein [Streptomyces sp. SID3343]